MQTHELAAGRHVGDYDLRVQVLMSIHCQELAQLGRPKVSSGSVRLNKLNKAENFDSSLLGDGH